MKKENESRIIKKRISGAIKDVKIWGSKLFGTGLPSGIITVPILIGIVMLLLNYRSSVAWGCLILGIILLLIQIILSLKITFNTTSLLDYFLMFGETFSGLILLARSFIR